MDDIKADETTLNTDKTDDINTISVPNDIPDALSIVLHTAIPQLGKFYYDPTMSIKNKNMITSQELIFNPLVKLVPGSLNQIPDYEQRVSTFFDKIAFESLIYNFSAEATLKIKKKELLTDKKKYAQFNDNINNNISLVLDTIFKSGETIYLGEKPFTILFYKLKQNKPRIKNKIETINADPNQTHYKIRAELLKRGNKNGQQFDQMNDDYALNLEDDMLSDKVIESVSETVSETIPGTNETTQNIKEKFNSTRQTFIDKKDKLINDTKKEWNDYKSIFGFGKKDKDKDKDNQNGGSIQDNKVEISLKHLENNTKSLATFIATLLNTFNESVISNPIILQKNNELQNHAIGENNIFTTNIIYKIIKSFTDTSNPKDYLSQILDSIGNKLEAKFLINYDLDQLSELDPNYNYIGLTYDEENNLLSYRKDKENNTLSHVMTGGNLPNWMRRNRDGRQDEYNNNGFYNPLDRLNRNPYVMLEDFDNTPLNKFEIDVHLEVTNKQNLTPNEIKCLTRRRKIAYNLKHLTRIENYFDFTQLSNMDLYDNTLDRSKIKPYIETDYMKGFDEKEPEK